MNNCSFTGRLTATPELKVTTSGKKVCNFTLAVDSRYKGNDNANYIDFVAWEHNAEFLCKWFDKGVRVAVTGELQTRLYEKDGKKNKVYEVLVNTVEFADGKRDANTNFDSAALDADNFIPLGDDAELPFN